MSIGKKIRITRRLQDMSQDELAALADIDKGTLFKIEKGITSPTWDTVVKITKALNLTHDSIASFF